MDFISSLNIGSVYQNISFYTFLSLLICLNFKILKYKSILKHFHIVNHH